MQYFKHYHNASTSISIQKIMKEHGVLGYGQWFLLLELLCEKFDGESDLIRVTTAEVVQKLRTKPAGVRQVLARFAGLADILEDIDGFEIIIRCPLLLDLQDRDFKRARKERGQGAPKKKNKSKDKEEDKEEEREVEYFSNPEKVNFSQVAELFNQKLADERISHENFLQSGEVVSNFVEKQKEFGLYSLSNWEPIFTRAKTSAFITKKLGVRSHFAWLLKDDNLKRLIKGDFDDKKNSTPMVDSYVNKWEAANG